MLRARPYPRVPVLVAAIGLAGLVTATLTSRGAPALEARFQLEQVSASGLLDAGRLLNDRPISIPLSVRNVGDAPLKLHKIVPSCKCLVSSAGGVEIPPQERHAVVLTFDPRGMWGAFTQLVTFETSDPRLPVVPVAVSGKLVEPLVPTPRFLDCGEIVAGGSDAPCGMVVLDVLPGVELLGASATNGAAVRFVVCRKSFRV